MNEENVLLLLFAQFRTRESMHVCRLLVPSVKCEGKQNQLITESKRTSECERVGGVAKKIKNQICVSVTYFHDVFRENFPPRFFLP